MSSSMEESVLTGGIEINLTVEVAAKIEHNFVYWLFHSTMPESHVNAACDDAGGSSRTVLRYPKVLLFYSDASFPAVAGILATLV